MKLLRKLLMEALRCFAVCIVMGIVVVVAALGLGIGMREAVEQALFITVVGGLATLLGVIVFTWG